MGEAGLFAQVVAVVGDAARRWRRLQHGTPAMAVGTTPVIPAGDATGDDLASRNLRPLVDPGFERREIARPERGDVAHHQEVGAEDPVDFDFFVR